MLIHGDATSWSWKLKKGPTYWLQTAKWSYDWPFSSIYFSIAAQTGAYPHRFYLLLCPRSLFFLYSVLINIKGIKREESQVKKLHHQTDAIDRRIFLPDRFAVFLPTIRRCSRWETIELPYWTIERNVTTGWAAMVVVSNVRILRHLCIRQQKKKRSQRKHMNTKSMHATATVRGK